MAAAIEETPTTEITDRIFIGLASDSWDGRHRGPGIGRGVADGGLPVTVALLARSTGAVSVLVTTLETVARVLHLSV